MQTIMTTMPKIEFAKDGWQTSRGGAYRTILEVDYRTREICVYKVHQTEVWSMPIRCYNGHAIRFNVQAGTPKAEIIEMVNYYANEIMDVMNAYEANASNIASIPARFDRNDLWMRDTKHWYEQGLRWALNGE